MSHSDLEKGHPGFVQNTHQTRREKKKNMPKNMHGDQRVTATGDCCKSHAGKQHGTVGAIGLQVILQRNPCTCTCTQSSVQSCFFSFLFGIITMRCVSLKVLFSYAKIRSKTLNQLHDSQLLRMQRAIFKTSSTQKVLA